MRRINIYPRAAGDVVQLRILPNGKFLGYVVFVRKHTSSGSHTESSHLPAANGEISVQLQLQACKGYDLILTGVPRPSGGAAIQYEIAFNAALTGNLAGPESITKSSPSVAWTILV